METKGKQRRTAFSAGLALAGMVIVGCGGAPSELEFKGLRLGMPVEKAARVLLDHGLPPGGDAEWPRDDADKELRELHRQA